MESFLKIPIRVSVKRKEQLRRRLLSSSFQVPGAAEVIAAQERVLAQERAQTAPVAPQVPGLAQHAAAEAQVNIVYYFIL